MGLNKPVGFPTAKLLKEKGFDRVTTSAYHKNSGELIFTDWDNVESNDDILIPKSFNTDKESWLISAPTIADVVMWLYEKHGIWIYSFRHDFDKEFYWSIDTKNEDEFTSDNVFNSPTEAYSEAIDYTLNNLL